MKILVACEASGKVREAFRRRGHDAFSCDLLPSLDGSMYHVKGDVLTLLEEGIDGLPNEWDMLIAHPPCTYLCNSGVHLLHNKKVHMLDGSDEGELEWYSEYERVKERFENLLSARAFFMTLWNLEIPKIVIENPVPHKYAMLPKYTQTIQPYQFGDDASKRTCLWLKGLPKLSIPDSELWVKPRIIEDGPYKGKKRWSNQTDSGQNKLGPSEDRGHLRSITYDGIAEAFASNWG